MKSLDLLRPLAAAAVLSMAPLHAALAADPDAATAQARAAADAAHEVLVDRYRTLWASLGKQQKGAFAQRERAWLNEGRAEEERACAVRQSAQGAHSAALAAQLCRLKVTEQKLASLPTARATVASVN